MKSTSFLAGMLILLLGFTPVQGKDQTFRIDKDLNFISTNLTSAVCRDNGNILVVINELKSNDLSYGRIHSILLKRRSDGTYAATKVRRLSPDSGSHVRPSVAYLSQPGVFVVVWDDAGRVLSGSPSKIIGQLVNAKNGKPKKGNFDLVDTGAVNLQPVIANVREKPDSPPTGTSLPGEVTEENISFVLVWSRYSTSAASPAGEGMGGLRFVPGSSFGNNKIRGDFNKEVAADMLVKHNEYQLSAFATKVRTRWSYDDTKLDYRLGLTVQGEDQIPDGSLWEWQGIRLSFNVSFENHGNQNILEKTGEYLLPEGTNAPTSLLVSPRGAEMKLKMFVAPSNQGFRRIVFEDDQIKDDEPLAFDNKTILGARLIRFNPRITFGPQDVGPAGKPVYGYIIAALGDGAVYHQRLTDGGADVKKLKRIFTHGGRLQLMNTRRIYLDEEVQSNPRDNNVLVLWQKRISDTRHEAWAYFTYLK